MNSDTPFKNHRAFNRLYAPNRLTLGIFLPLDVYRGNLAIFNDHLQYIQQIDQKNFGAIWVRDIPLFDPNFGDAARYTTLLLTCLI